ncbi:hypothetical protein [Sinorhizobium medicae]|uniref:hypothetical protein n=1 Tax=Sinorhizobium medicae TaxID=110321 RepID=UPI000FD88D12|nr:hypothetical protein [Sinorhizobium medicae]MDX0439142.1 hypothetical protein [Sinorhizobium medicae]MDX0617561.1 hypothetical protein [Sinorhizobium medicae]MDX0654712.1 hypothetical protein [Sinorhizobium medicae]MDX1090920.1 hypothetical protein [Sinorhizobium medicae]MDX1115553.1 hypothetical protein [Sinorhizobium medicae]
MTFFAFVYSFLNTWQTLIGSILAVIAAIVTVWEMRRQSRGDETRHQNELARKKMSARARMPDALSEMSAYVRNAAKSLVLGENRPLPPVAAMTTLKDVIEHIDTKQAERTFELVSWYQVQHSRLIGSDKPKKIERDEMLYDLALLQTQINRLFDYARNEPEQKRPEKPSSDEMAGSLKNAVTVQVWAMENDDFKGVIEIINRRHN